MVNTRLKKYEQKKKKFKSNRKKTPLQEESDGEKQNGAT